MNLGFGMTMKEERCECRPVAIGQAMAAAADIEGAVARAKVAARASVARDQRARRDLDVLRTNYPGWNIYRRRDQNGRERWVAELISVITPEMKEAGAVATIDLSDAVALAAALSWQTDVLHQFRAP
ncbi:hypothetical protein [Nonomuraea fuscirosea]|uniref:hypothetical protein n=1 Tax=Nonomuraea fuscirosea TaxID=1291556 RepID=UPI0011B1C870|nr:hypothetical protein [Nonomuraea fuscirosea]